jgi:hypothetical protein
MVSSSRLFIGQPVLDITPSVEAGARWSTLLRTFAGRWA